MLQGSPRTSSRSRLSSYAFALAAALALLISMELLLGTWARYFRTPYETWDAQRQTPALVPGIHPTPFGPVAIDELGFEARPDPEDARVDGVPMAPYRIASLGDSCTFGAGAGDATYPATLEKRIRRHRMTAQAPFEYQVFNAGISGLTSAEAIGRLDYTLDALRPDVVTIYVGWNDLMKTAPRSQSEDAAVSTLWRRIDHLWLARGLRKLLFFHLRARFSSPRVGEDGATGRFRSFRPTYFEDNLRELIRRAREAGARPVLLTLPHSLRRDLLPKDLAGRRIQYPYFLFGNSLGDFMDLIETYNESIRRIGRETDTPVADLAARFEKLSHPEAFFLDTMHPNPRGDALIAEVLERILTDEGLLVRPGLPSPPGSDE